MEKFLIFDADRSLATLGTPKDIESLSGFPEVPVTLGINQISQALGFQGDGLFKKVSGTTQHPLFPKVSIPTLNYEPAPMMKTSGITGIVIDTISHTFGQDMRILEGKRNSKQLEMQDWGHLERSYLGFLESLKNLPCWVIVNCHITYDKDQASGTFYFAPLVKGVTKDRMREFFDVVLYTRTSSDKKSYTWQSYADASRMGKDRLSVLEPTMPQDFSTVISKYRTKGYEPKILVIGESGTGKTRALQTISKL